MPVTAPWPSNPTNMALLVVDVQNDLTDPAGTRYVHGAEQIISRINEEIAAARGSGAPVVYTQNWQPASTAHTVENGDGWPTHCVQDTWGAQFHPGLRIEGPVVQKGTGGEDGYSGFNQQPPRDGPPEPTGLDALLKEHHIHDLVVVGLAQDACVKETVLDALRLGYHVLIPIDATRATERQVGDGQAAFAAMEQAGAQLLGP